MGQALDVRMRFQYLELVLSPHMFSDLALPAAPASGLGRVFRRGFAELKEAGV